MSELPNEKGPGYPFGFDPEQFESPELCLAAVAQPGFIGLGEAVESKEALNYDELREEMAKSGINVGILSLTRIDGNIAYFPIYLDTAKAEVSILPEHFEKASTIVANNVAFASLDEAQKQQEIINLAFTLASSPPEATVLRITGEGQDLITYPQQEGQNDEI